MRAKPACLALLAFAMLAACGSGSSSVPHGAPTTTPTATPTPLGTGTPVPTAMPTTAIVPTSACKELAQQLPGTYATISTLGNLNGSSYVQSPGVSSGTWSAAAYATATPGPSPLPTVAPTPAPSASPQTYIEYSGTYNLTGFQGHGPSGDYTVMTTTGCFLLVVTQDGQPVEPSGAFNSFAIGFPGFSSKTGIMSTPVAHGSITSFTVTNLSPSSGDGNFLLDNNASGTVTIEKSQVVSFARARRLLER